MEDKLKNLLTSPASHSVLTTKWLRQSGYSSQLLHKYARSGWLTSIGHGAYARDVSRITWQHGLHALQTQLQLPVWLGGFSALSLHGLAHQVAMGRERIWLYAHDAPHLPKWFTQHSWTVEFVLINRRLFSEPPDEHLVTRDSGDVPLRVSRAEQAVLEYLDRVKDRAAFEDAADVMNGVMTLSPQRLQQLLETCRSIRAKRLVLYFADHYRLPWRTQLDASRVNLGSGPRQIVAEGRLDSKYQIIIPRGLGDGV